MSFLKGVVAFLAVLPELIEFVKQMNKRAKMEEKKRQLKSDIKKINKALETKDEKILNEILNS